MDDIQTAIADYERRVSMGEIHPWDPDNPPPVDNFTWIQRALDHLSLLDREP